MGAAQSSPDTLFREAPIERFEARARSRWTLPLVGLLSLVAVVAAAAGGNAVLGPAHYEVRLTADELVVDAALGLFDEGRRVSRAGLRAREVATAGMRRRSGTARPDHCSGHWSQPDLGAFWLMSTCGDEGVLVEGTDPPWVLGLAEPAAFVDALYGGDTGTYDASEARAPSAWWRLLQLGLAVLMGGVLLLPLWLLRVASAMRYDIVGDELRVPGLLGTRTVRLPGARVELQGHHRRGRMIRVAGAALPGLHMGLYRAQGRWVHMSATSLRDVVVVQGPERTVLVTPAEPGAFVQALVARGAVRA